LFIIDVNIALSLNRRISILYSTCWMVIFLVFHMSCSSSYKFKSGEEAYERKQYKVAVDILTEEYKENNNKSAKARNAYLIGMSFNAMNDYSSALGWFETALDLEDRTEILTELAYGYKRTGNYSSAIKAFSALYKKVDYKDDVERELIICRRVIEWEKERKALLYKIQPVASNTEFSEFGVAKYEDDQIVFTSDRNSELNTDSYKWSGNSFSDIYISDYNGNNIQLFDKPINSEHNEGMACFNKDFSEIYFTRCESQNLRDEHCRIYYAYHDFNGWSDPYPLSFFNENVNYGSPVLFNNDSILIFSSNVSGVHDLYYSIRENRAWSAAIAMPDYINTRGNEKFPTADEDTLYFSSDYHAGLGGLDIFKIVLRADGSFTQPENLRSPINSSYDDFGYVVVERDDSVLKGFISSSRGNKGADDIFRFSARKNPEEIKEETEIETDTIVLSELYLALKVVGADPDEQSIKKIPLPDSKLLLSIDKVSTTESLDAKAYLIKEIENKGSITIKVSNPNYFTQTITIDIEEELPDSYETSSYTINKTITLNPIIRDKEIVLENIYYDFDQWNIREDARPSLDELTQLLADNPTINIQLSSHTDCRGETDYNETLSQKRAQSAVDYIAEKGIRATRMVAKGYGENLLSIDCICDDCTEEQHQTNRRTTFKVID